MIRFSRHIILLAMVIFLFTIPFLFASCGDNSQSGVTIDYESGSIPTVRTDSVSALIYDSGIVKYKVITQKWDIYEQTKDKYSHFPEGLYLEQLDSTFAVVMSVKADTAWNFSSKKIWKLKGNVFIENRERQLTYESDEFYWDEQRKKIYSDSLVKIHEPGQLTLYGTRFTADDRLEEVSFIKVGRHAQGKTLVVVNEEEENKEGDSEEKAE